MEAIDHSSLRNQIIFGVTTYMLYATILLFHWPRLSVLPGNWLRISKSRLCMYENSYQLQLVMD